MAITTDAVRLILEKLKLKFGGYVSQTRIEEILQEAVNVLQIHEPMDLWNDFQFFLLATKEWEDRWSSQHGEEKLKAITDVYTKWMLDVPSYFEPDPTSKKYPKPETRCPRLAAMILGFGFGAGLGSVIHFLLHFLGFHDFWHTIILVMIAWVYCRPYLLIH